MQLRIAPIFLRIAKAENKFTKITSKKDDIVLFIPISSFFILISHFSLNLSFKIFY